MNFHYWPGHKQQHSASSSLEANIIFAQYVWDSGASLPDDEQLLVSARGNVDVVQEFESCTHELKNSIKSDKVSSTADYRERSHRPER